MIEIISGIIGTDERKLHGTCTIDFEISMWSYYHITCEFNNGLLNGAYLESHNGSNSIICQYRDGVIHGAYKELETNITTKSCYYTYGKKNGIYKENYSNGNQRIRCNYLNDMKVGEYFKYYSNGLIERYCSNYDNDVIDGIYAIFDEYGELLQETKYNKGKKNGPHKTYYPIYHIIVEEIFENDILKSSEKYDTDRLAFMSALYENMSTQGF
jgi:antitoxin component YwqK of YwqJK toxin-antitoxin module